MSKLWDDTLAQLELNLSPQHFSTWIKPLKLVRIEQDMVYLEVPNRFVLDWVKENYSKLIQKILSELSAVTYRLQFTVDSKSRDNLPKRTTSVETAKPVVVKEKPVANNHPADINLNRKYTFEEFVAGSSNQFAYAAAMAVANNPATTYNPLEDYEELTPSRIMAAPTVQPDRATAQDPGLVEHGGYLVELIGCAVCHTDGALIGEPRIDEWLAGSDVGIAYWNPMK